MIDYKEERRKLEEYILSAAIIENKVVEVISFLSYRNFTIWDDYDYQEAWAMITTMYKEGRIIDIMTFSIEYKKRFKKSIFNHVVDLSNRLASTMNTQHHAAILVQIDITDKLIEVLTNLSMNHNLPESERIEFKNAANDLVDYNIDVFEAIDGIVLMINHKNYSQVAEREVRKFADMVNKKIEGIKRNDAKVALLSNIRCLCVSEKAKYLLMQLEAEI